MLLERDDELRALEAVLDTGGVLVVEGGVGIGKTSLLRHGAERARRRGWRPLRGVGSELETGFAFGVVRQLFERELAAADPGQRAEWLAGPAGAVRGLLDGPSAVPGNGAPEPFAVVHGLYWLTVNMAAVRAAAPAIRPSLLSAAGAAAVVRAALGPGTPDTRCQALHAASGGNPFFWGS